MPSVANNPLEQAIARGCVECIRILVASSPFYDLNGTVGPDGLLPVHVAAREGHLQVLRYLQSAGVCLQGLDSKGSNGVHYAVRAGQPRAVRWLLRHGVQSVVNSSNESPSAIASQLHHMEIISLLSKYGNKSEQQSPAGPPIEDSRQVDSGNSSLSSTNPPASLTLTGSCHCSTESTSSRNSSSAEETSPPLSSAQSNYTVRSVNSFFLHPPKSRASSSNSSQSSPNSFFLHNPRPSTAVTIQEETDSDPLEVPKLKSNLKQEKPAASFILHQSPGPASSTSTLVNGASPSPPLLPLPPQVPLPPPPRETCVKFEIPSSDFSNSSSSHTRTNSNSNNNSTSFHLHDEPPLSIQYSLDYSIETTMAPVNNQFVLSSPVVVKSEPKDVPRPPPPPPFADSSPNSPSVPSSPSNPNVPPPPPPPPPPLPFFANPPMTNGNSAGIRSSPKLEHAANDIKPNPAELYNIKNIIKEKVSKSKSSPPGILRTTCSNTVAQSPGASPVIENEYEDIEEIQRNREAEESENNSGNNKSSASNIKYHHNELANGIANGINALNKAPVKKIVGNKQVPFIPPSFPAPPEEDQLIKPSEYLKSIKCNGNGGKTNGSSSTSNGSSSPPAICLATTGSNDNSNAENDKNECSVTKENESKAESGDCYEREPPPPPPLGMMNNSNKSSGGGATTGGGGLIRPEELMKVNLRKAPTIRTTSAPPLGRVLSTNNNSNCNNSKNSEAFISPSAVSAPCGNNYGITRNNNSNPPAPANTKAAVIAELEQSSQLGSVREWKEELRRRQLEEEKMAVKELAQYYTPVNFVAEVPSTDGSGAAIPAWKRQMLAKKAAEKARKEAEEQLKQDAEAKRMASIPPWRRQLLQRRESDGKCVQ